MSLGLLRTATQTFSSALRLGGSAFGHVNESALRLSPQRVPPRPALTGCASGSASERSLRPASHVMTSPASLTVTGTRHRHR